MPSLTTVYRAIVMVAAGVIVVKGWQYCEPSADQVKAIASRAAEIGQEAWCRIQSSAGSGQQVAPSSRALAPPVGQQQATVAADPPGFRASGVMPAAFTSGVMPDKPAIQAPPMLSQPAPSEEPVASASEKSSSLAVADANSLTMLLTRLKELGGIEPAFETWGSSGNLCRFCCRATLADNPQITRHFEAVAAEQLAAVENVVAKVQSWRAERERSQR